MGQTQWADTTVRAWLSEGADTLRRLPAGLARPRLSYWPLVNPAAVDGWRPHPPLPAAIDRLDRVLLWLRLCEPAERQILWARASGFSWRRIAMFDGRSHTQVRNVEAAAIDRIVAYLRAGGEEAPVPLPRGPRRAVALRRRRPGPATPTWRAARCGHLK